MPFVDSGQLPGGEPLPGWVARFFHSDNLTLAYYEIAPNAAPLHEHSHPQEEVWNVMDGHVAVTIDGVECVVGSGCAAIVPANTPHSARVARRVPRDRRRLLDPRRSGRRSNGRPIAVPAVWRAGSLTGHPSLLRGR
jgi:unsaturated pyranuronate lyase